MKELVQITRYQSIGLFNELIQAIVNVLFYRYLDCLKVEMVDDRLLKIFNDADDISCRASFNTLLANRDNHRDDAFRKNVSVFCERFWPIILYKPGQDIRQALLPCLKSMGQKDAVKLLTNPGFLRREQ